MDRTVFYVAHAARHYPRADDQRFEAKRRISGALREAASGGRGAFQVGVTDDRLVPYPRPIDNLLGAVESLFVPQRTIDAPAHELRVFYHVAARQSAEATRRLSADLDDLDGPALYRRLSDVLATTDRTDGDRLDILVEARSAARADDRAAVREMVLTYLDEATATFEDYCERATRQAGFALGRLVLAARDERVTEAIARRIGTYGGLRIVSFDLGGRRDSRARDPVVLDPELFSGALRA